MTLEADWLAPSVSPAPGIFIAIVNHQPGLQVVGVSLARGVALQVSISLKLVALKKNQNEQHFQFMAAKFKGRKCLYGFKFYVVPKQSK